MKYLNVFLKFGKEMLKIIVFVISLIFSFYYIFSTIYSTLFSDLFFYKEELLSNSSIQELSYILIPTIFIIWILNYKKTLKIIFSKEEKVILLFSSYFFSYFVLTSFGISGRLFVILIIFIIAFIYYLLIIINNFFYDFSLSYFKKLLRSEKNKLEKGLTKITYVNIAMFISISLLMIGLTGFIIFKINSYLDYHNQLRRSFVITKIIPKNTTQAEGVILKGYKFGWKLNESYRIMSETGQINDIKLWTDTEIQFNVPLHIKDGKNIIWIERTVDDSSQSAKMTSNKIELNIISRWEFYPSQINYENPFYPLQKENLIRRIRRFLFFKLKLGDIMSLL